METTVNEKNMVAFCGLYCKNCSKFKNGKCPGCEMNEKASWCTIRKCCIEKNIQNCAYCDEFVNLTDCKKYNNVFAKVIQFVTNTDRELCIQMIRENGVQSFIRHMDIIGKMSLPKQKK